MSIKYGFFNSNTVDGVKDRLYNAEDITSYFDDIIGSGVFVDPANSLQVMANSGLTIMVKAGRGWINGHYLKNTEDLALTIDQADASLNRIDRVVFYLDKVNRLMGIRVNKGTPATTAVAPALVRNSDVQEYSLATISIPANTTAISQTNITDTRLDSTVCGKVAVLIEQIDTSDIYAQFNSWLSNIEQVLHDSNIFAEYKTTITVTDSLSEFDIPVTDYVAAYDILNIFVNGIRLEASEYLATTTTVTLNNPITVAGTKVEIVVLKNINAAEADVETLAEAVTEIADDVSDHEVRLGILEKYIYRANGVNDNTELSSICQNFLEGTGAFSGAADYAHMEIEVEGNFTVAGIYSGSGTEASPYSYLTLGKLSGSTTNRTLTLNFRKCSRIEISGLTGYSNIISGSNITIEGLELVYTGGQNINLFSGVEIICRDSKFNVNGSGNIVGGNCCGIFENVRMSITSSGGNAFGYSGNGAGILTIRGGTIYAYTGASDKESVGIYVQANKTENVLIADGVNVPVNARAGYYQTDTVKINSGFYSLQNCVLGKAASKYSTGEGKTETGTMIISKIL